MAPAPESFRSVSARLITFNLRVTGCDAARTLVRMLRRIHLNPRSILASLVGIPVTSVALAVLGCSDDGSPSMMGRPSTPVESTPGALVEVSLSSQVGVLLDEIPISIRERVASALLEKADDFWVTRAKRQLTLATYRLNFRPAFYADATDKKQIPLPPEQVLNVRIAGAARRTSVEGHDYVLVDYALDSLIVTDVDSPGTSEPALAAVGGVWVEPFTFPVDPELLVQRTGYACMDEAEFPPNSVDTENVEFYYDQECDVEDSLTPDGCHYTALPTESCQDALSAHVGKVEAPLSFERVAWDPARADRARVGSVTNPEGVDLEVVSEELAVNRLIYRYIDDSSCALAEQCVTGSGWRRLLMFNASEKNLGAQPLNIGDVDYFLDDPDNPTPNANHHIYEYSACHEHYHFSHYASFSFGDDPNLGSKRAFCLESVARYSNDEHSPTWSPYNDCAFQGISQGWGDQYNAGIECQWLDLTSVDTQAGPVTRPLGFKSNPDGFLCEGEPMLDEDHSPLWEPTAFLTTQGETVDRPMCSFLRDWDANNAAHLDVTLPVPGEGMLTSACTRGQIGRLRNCGFSAVRELRTCSAGTTSVSCSIPAGSAPQVVRVCEASTVLGAGVACSAADALANIDIEGSDPIELPFVCPPRRDAAEPGGLYALYTAPSFGDDKAVPVTCAPLLESSPPLGATGK
jgi:hypothetical protein